MRKSATGSYNNICEKVLKRLKYYFLVEVPIYVENISKYVKIINFIIKYVIKYNWCFLCKCINSEKYNNEIIAILAQSWAV